MSRGSGIQASTGGLAAAIGGTWSGTSDLLDRPNGTIRCANTAKPCRAILRDGKKEGELCSACENPKPFAEEEERSASIHASYGKRSEY